MANCGGVCQLDDEQRKAVESELADVLIYLVRLADELEVDLLVAYAKNETNRSVSTQDILKAGERLIPMLSVAIQEVL